MVDDGPRNGGKHARQPAAHLRALGAPDARLVRPVGRDPRPDDGHQRRVAEPSRGTEARAAVAKPDERPARSARSGAGHRGGDGRVAAGRAEARSCGEQRAGRARAPGAMGGEGRPRSARRQAPDAARALDVCLWRAQPPRAGRVLGGQQLGQRAHHRERLLRDAHQPAQGRRHAGAVDPADRHAGRQPDLPVAEWCHPVVGNQPAPPTGHRHLQRCPIAVTIGLAAMAVPQS